MKTLTRWFFNGLVAFVPISGTIYIAWWLASWADSIFGAPLRRWLNVRSGEGDVTSYYFYGLGIICMVVLLVGLGICMEFYLGKLLLRWSEQLVTRIPVVKTIYSSIKEMLVFINPSKAKSGNNYMVVVEIMPNIKILGYVTREDLYRVKGGLADEGEVAVVVPFCYQMGGNTIIVPKRMVKPLDMSFEEGMKLALTGFVISADKDTGIRPSLPAGEGTGA